MFLLLLALACRGAALWMGCGWQRWVEGGGRREEERAREGEGWRRRREEERDGGEGAVVVRGRKGGWVWREEEARW